VTNVFFLVIGVERDRFLFSLTDLYIVTIIEENRVYISILMRRHAPRNLNRRCIRSFFSLLIQLSIIKYYLDQQVCIYHIDTAIRRLFSLYASPSTYIIYYYWEVVMRDKKHADVVAVSADTNHSDWSWNGNSIVDIVVRLRGLTLTELRFNYLVDRTKSIFCLFHKQQVYI
jgi:hypothetical protein